MSIFKQIREALVDIEYHDEAPATKEEISFAGSMRRFNKRLARIHEVAPNHMCPKCGTYTPDTHLWVVKKDTVICRSCYFVADAYFWDGAKYRALMKSNSITHREIARQSGLSYSLLSKLPKKTRISTWVLYILIESYDLIGVDPKLIQECVGGIAGFNGTP